MNSKSASWAAVCGGGARAQVGGGRPRRRGNLKLGGWLEGESYESATGKDVDLR